MGNNYKIIVEKIISAQEAIVGPIAQEMANKIEGINNPNKQVLEKLVNEYAGLFGQASIETCKEAISQIVAQNKDIDLPDNLH